MRPLALRAAALVFALALPCRAAPDAGFDGRGKEPRSLEEPRAPAARAKPLNLDQRLWIVARAASPQARSAVADAGISIEEIFPDKVAGIGTARMARRLARLGISFSSQPLDQRFRVEDFPQQDSNYHNYERMTQQMSGIAASAPGLASLFSIGKSLKGRELWALRLNTTASGAQKSDKPGIVFLGTHHAREHLSTETPLLLAKHLVDNRHKPEISPLLAARDIHIIPMVNPDGVEHDIRDGRYHMHRKNLRDNGDGAVGVDLNRNYGFHWGEGGASPDPDSDIYRGPSAFSEPETQAVRDFIEARKDTIKILLSYHTFSELILYPWGHTYDPLPDSRALAAYRAMAGAMGQMTGYRPQQSSQLYIASGDTTDWAWGAHRIFSFTFELYPKSMWGGGFYPGAAAVASTLANNIRPALYLIGLADDPYRAAEAAETAAAPPAHAVPTGGR